MQLLVLEVLLGTFVKKSSVNCPTNKHRKHKLNEQAERQCVLFIFHYSYTHSCNIFRKPCNTGTTLRNVCIAYNVVVLLHCHIFSGIQIGFSRLAWFRRRRRWRNWLLCGPPPTRLFLHHRRRQKRRRHSDGGCRRGAGCVERRGLPGQDGDLTLQLLDSLVLLHNLNKYWYRGGNHFIQQKMLISTEH